MSDLTVTPGVFAAVAVVVVLVGISGLIWGFGTSPVVPGGFALVLALLLGTRRLRFAGSSDGEGASPADSAMSRTRRALRPVTVLLGAVFLTSAAFNLGASIAFGSVIGFPSPSASTAYYELAIGAVLVAAAALSNLYLYGGAYLFASVGIAEGLLSPDVQGLARSLHEVMVPLAVIAWVMVAAEAGSASRRRPAGVGRTREVVTALQFFVGALVTLGGAAYARGGAYPLGNALGLVHLSVGLAGLFGGYAFFRGKPWSRTFLIMINGVTIGYSTFAEAMAELYALLPPGVTDSLIGTIVAVVVSIVILYLLRSGSRSQE